MSEQIELLANFIMASVDGEPSKSEGAGDCAIRIIADLQADNAALKRENEAYQRLDEEGYASLAVQLVDAENEIAALKGFIRKAWKGPRHTTIDATKCKGLVDWVCDTMDEAASLLTAEESDDGN